MRLKLKITRRLRLFLETVLVLVMLMAGAFGWGVWQLSEGPMDLKPFLPTLSRTFQSWMPGITFAIGDASLEWGGQQTPFVLRVRNVDLISPRGRTIGRVDEMAVGLAPQALLVGQVSPTTLDIMSPTLAVTRYPDGHLGLRFDRNETKEENKSDDTLAMADIINLLKADHYVFTAFLERIMVSDITLVYRDFISRRNSIARKGKLLIERDEDNYLTGQGLIDLPVGDVIKQASLDIRADHTKHVSLATLRMPSLTNHDMLAFAPEQTWITHFSGTLDTELTLALDTDLATRFIEISGRTDNSQIIAPKYFADPLPITTAQFSVMYDTEKQVLGLRDTHIVFPDATLNVLADIDEPFSTEKPFILNAQAQLNGMKMKELYRYWPMTLADSARDWVTQHITVGVADKAAIKVTMAAPAGALHNGGFDKSEIAHFGGFIEFTGLTTDYLPPMIPVTDINGRADFTLNDFIITPTSGSLRDTRVKDGKITISPFDLDKDTNLALDLNLEGPLQDALVLLADKPLEFTQQVGIDPKNITGQATTNLKLDFPLLDDLMMEQVQVKAAAKLKDTTVRKAYRDATLHGQELDLTVDNDGLVLDGKATLSGAQLSNLHWTESFGDDATIRRQFDLKGQATPALLKDMHLGADAYFKNYAGVTATVIESANGDTDISIKGDLTPAEISIPALNVKKSAGQPGDFATTITAKNNQGASISDLSITTPSLRAQKGSMQFDMNGSLQSLHMTNVQAGKSRVSVTAKALPRGKGWDATINGSVLDLSGLMADDGTTPPAKPETTRPPVRLNINVNTLMLDADYPMQKVIGKFFIDNSVILQADMDAMTGTTPLRLRFSPQKGGNRVLSMSSDNAGDALRALNITDSVQGGTLSLNGGSDAATPQQIRGNLVIKDFTMIKAPLLARLLNAFSLGGLRDLLNKKGLSFGKLQTDLTYQDGMIIVKNGKMAGASLGLNVSGTVDQKNGQMDLGGTVVPIEGINKLVSNIPLVGQILTGLKGEGLVAATYRVKGPTRKPDVTVNPLSVLTPGILRSIFFESLEK